MEDRSEEEELELGRPEVVETQASIAYQENGTISVGKQSR
jgi:hypothetical protein